MSIRSRFDGTSGHTALPQQFDRRFPVHNLSLQATNSPSCGGTCKSEAAGAAKVAPARILLRILAVCIAAGFISMVAYGQGVTGTITGVIKDPNGLVVPGAKVIARNAGTNAESVTTTEATGFYKIVNLVSGMYVIEVEAPGFRKITTNPQRLSTGDVLRMDLTLELGQVSEVVTVEETASRVNAEESQTGQALQDVYKLPIISGAGGRNALSLAVLQPGVVVPGGSVAIGPISVNGQRSQSNNYMLDGGDSNDQAINTPNAVTTISPNAISEFRVITGSMKAEYGRNSGAIVLVTTRSGDNNLHLIASEIFRNTKLNTVPFFQKAIAGGTPQTLPGSGFPRRPQWNTNDFDADVSGPIIKDKSFFFVSYLGFRRRQGVSQSATVFSNSDRALINQYGTPEAKALTNLVPLPNYGADTLLSAPANQFRRDQGMVNWDHNISAANRLSFRFFLDDRTAMDPFAFGGGPVPGFGTLSNVRETNYVLRDTHTFSPNVLNEFRLAFHRLSSQGVVPVNTTSLKSLGLTGINPDNPAAEGPPTVDLSAAGLDMFGNSYQGPQSRWDNTWQWIDNMSWIKGTHYIKFGGEARSYAQNQLFSFLNNGYIYSDGAGVDGGYVDEIPGMDPALNDFAKGFTSDFEQSNTSRQGYRTRAYALFLQDDWKVKSNFTLNLGLRWELNQPITEVGNRVLTFRKGQQSTVFPTAPLGLVYAGDAGITNSTYQTDKNDFGPRVGFAWDPFKNGKVSVRGGYGLMYDAPITELTLQFLGVPPYGLQSVLTSGTFYRAPFATQVTGAMPNPFPFVPVSKGSPYDYTQIAPLGITIMDPYFRTPYSQQANLNVQYQFAKDWLLDTGYVWTNGVKLLGRTQYNPAMAGPGATSINTDQRRIYNLNNPLNADYGGAVWSGITDQGSFSNSNYNALQVMVTKRFGHGLMMTHSYTWSHTIDDTSGLRGNTRFNLRSADRGNSDQDVRHRYVMFYLYELPMYKDQAGVLGKVLGGWSISGITTFQSGVPFNITEPTDRSLSGSGADRPDYVGGTLRFFDPRVVGSVPGKANAYFDGTGGGTATAATSPVFRRVGSGTSWTSGAGRFGTFGRNVYHGPGLNNFDFSVYKKIQFMERHSVEFSTQFFNLWNHAQFLAPNANIGSAAFGRVTNTRDPRLIQMGLKYMF